MLGMSQAGYSQWETGENDIPAQIRIRPADFYPTSVDYRFGRTDVYTPHPGRHKP